jgi:GTPase SAR1 family protein
MSLRQAIQAELQEYLRSSNGKETSDTGFEVTDAFVVNVLIVGRSQSGKTTLVESLKSTFYASHLTGFSDTRHVQHHPIVTRDKVTDKCYQINLIDTIGLSEQSRDPANKRSDHEILLLAAKFIQKQVTSLNAVLFVTKAGDTHLHDLAAFKSIMNFLGPAFKENSMMILTHCESLSLERFNELANSIRTNSLSKEVSDYCTLGIHPHGTLNFDQLETFTGEENTEFRRLFMENKLKMVVPMRRNIIQLLIGQTGKERPVKELQEIMVNAEKERMRFVEEEIKRRGSCTIL